ncbi:RTA1 like protein-domain-containing protein [Dactylonectria macrodidyma]|uniref:RTA1 like protein-domain-containing protein n=1 Tax=Dactylonectria macrodidyma TaxID=307937 RepID=A0A9P9F825_9HYPO|nr:RTA1 like protein-domain-containing protein [Dactylonectria macrodidyma]
MPTLETYNGYPLWRYIPSLPAAIIFVVVFAILTAAHSWKLFRHRMWFCFPFVVGGLFEIIGYIGRVAAYNSTGTLIPYILQSIFLLIAPILFAASLYMTLSRIILAVGGASCSMIAPRWLTRIFVFGDAFSFLIQSSGAGLRVRAGSGSSTSNPNLGSNIIVGGLIFQIAIFAIFVITAVRFQLKFRRHEASKNAMDIPWQACLNMLYVTSAFIMIRNIFRVAEYAMGSDGYLLGHEWGVYVFDASLMTLTMVWFFLRYPSQLAAKKRSEIEIEMSPTETS